MRARTFAAKAGSLARIAASGKSAAAAKRGTVLFARRAPATPAHARPTDTPASRPSTTHDRQRRRRSDCTQIHAAVMPDLFPHGPLVQRTTDRASWARGFARF